MVKASRAHALSRPGGLPSGLHSHAALATISAPVRSGPSFPHFKCQGSHRLSRAKLAVICGARPALRRWSCSNCERRGQRIHVSAIRTDDLIFMFRAKRRLHLRHCINKTAEKGVSDQRGKRKTAEFRTSGAKRVKTWRGG